MSDNVDVQILERADEGDREVGTGVLVHPHLVAVRPPLDEIIRNLADPSVPTFGVRFPGPGEAVQEVSSVLLSEGEEPLVALEVAAAGPDTTLWRPGVDTANQSRELRSYLAGAGAGGVPETGGAASAVDACSIWPGASFCHRSGGTE